MSASKNDATILFCVCELHADHIFRGVSFPQVKLPASPHPEISFCGSVGQCDSISIHQPAWQLLILWSSARYNNTLLWLLVIWVPGGWLLRTSVTAYPFYLVKTTFLFDQHLHPWQEVIGSVWMLGIQALGLHDIVEIIRQMLWLQYDLWLVGMLNLTSKCSDVIRISNFSRIQNWSCKAFEFEFWSKVFTFQLMSVTVLL